jgi:hypothetical protein
MVVIFFSSQTRFVSSRATSDYADIADIQESRTLFQVIQDCLCRSDRTHADVHKADPLNPRNRGRTHDDGRQKL